MRKTTTLILIAVTLLPFLWIVNTPTSWSLAPDNWKALSLWLSSFLGYFGVGILFWQFVLGTRSVSGLFFEDIGWAVRVHRLLGKYGTLLIFLHPLLVTYYYGEKLVLYALTPNFSTEFETHVTFGRTAFFLLSLVWLTSAILRSKIAYRPWKYVHYAVYAIIPAVILHVPEVGSSYSNKAIQFYWFSFVGLFALLALLRARHLFGLGKVKYVVAEHSKLTDTVHMLVMKPLSKWITARMGQYVYVQQKLLGEEHPFTVLYSKNDGTIAVAFKELGAYTKKLAAIKVNDEVLIDGPYGVFTKELAVEPKKPVVFIAGGIGITPFAAHVLQNPRNLPQKLLYANQTKESAALRDVLRNKLGNNYVDVFSSSDNVSGENTETGYITKEIIIKYVDDPGQHLFYICGPKPMMTAVKKELRALGVSKQSIFTEEFSY